MSLIFRDAKSFLPVLERKRGSVSCGNAFPTGVEVCDSMVHGGPYPASTNFGATSVRQVDRRFFASVCYPRFASGIITSRPYLIAPFLRTKKARGQEPFFLPEPLEFSN